MLNVSFLLLDDALKPPTQYIQLYSSKTTAKSNRKQQQQQTDRQTNNYGD